MPLGGQIVSLITVGAEAAGVGLGATGEREGGLPSACSAVGILGVAKKGVGSGGKSGEGLDRDIDCGEMLPYEANSSRVCIFGCKRGGGQRRREMKK